MQDTRVTNINAKSAKIHAHKVIRTLKTTEFGRVFLNNIYDQVNLHSPVIYSYLFSNLLPKSRIHTKKALLYR